MLCPDMNAFKKKHKPLLPEGLGQGHVMNQQLKNANPAFRWAHSWAYLGALLGCAGVWAQSELNPSPAALDLQLQARTWFSQQKSYPLERIQMSAMDNKLAVKACTGQMRFDQPFQNQNVVRARCSEPNSQYFLTAQVSALIIGKTSSGESGSLTPNIASSAPPVTPSVTPSTKPVELSSLNTAKTQPTLTSSAPAEKTPVFLPASYKPSINPNEVIKTVLVANQPLRRGTVLQASLFRRVDTPIANTDGQVLTQFKEIENSELLHDMGSDQVLHNFDIKPALMVKKGQQVTVMIGEGRGFLITVKAEAQQDGALGDQIRLKNIDSGRSISGVITGVSEVKVL